MNVSQVTKTYGQGRDRAIVLNKINVTVPCGSIYGLLGPSGCGKTTLLRCIVGRLRIDEGSLITLQKPPGTVGHHVPGKLVGYMPQELALYNEFTIEETLNYFGRVNGMSSDNIKSRTSFLVQFLKLPEKERIIRQLSGGQQRRTSFAIALLHEPKILILDEPTVGVDPVLRLKIWNHLLTISSLSHTTTIITTHYIEEARQANVVGLMRNGRLLAESTPDSLMVMYEKSSLEDVFLLLCEADKDDDDDNDNVDNRGSTTPSRPAFLDNFQPSVVIRTMGRGNPVDEATPLLFGNQNTQSSCDSIDDQCYQHSRGLTACQKIAWYLPTFRNVIALFIKNVIMLRRQIGVLMFEFLLPVVQITLFCLCIGGDPRHLRMGVVNNETCSESNETLCFSGLFLKNLDSKLIVQENFSGHFSDALSAARMGQTWGIIEIGENFTQCLIRRYWPSGVEGGEVDNGTIEGSTIHLYLDMTNQEISSTLTQEMMRAFQSFSEQMLIQLKLSPTLAQTPIKLESPIYGKRVPNFTDFMAPGIIITIPFFLATGLTALSFVIERKQGLLDRSLVSGVGAVEIMIGHIATQFLVMLVQVGLLLAIALAAFKISFEGSLVLVIILTLLQGLTGMALGFLISALCEEETSAIQFALGSVYPNLLLSGIIWPLEAMPTWLQYISYCLPMTFAAESMRSILSRGWGLAYVNVWRGFVMSIGWGSLLMILSAVALAVRRF